jgi:hypothetical protein
MISQWMMTVELTKATEVDLSCRIKLTDIRLECISSPATGGGGGVESSAS